MCFRRELLKDSATKGNVFYDRGLWDNILKNLKFLPRSKAENNYKCKQLVAYIVIKSGKSYLSYRRTEKCEEEELINKLSVGIGGHINISDRRQSMLDSGSNRKKMDFVLRAVRREIKEEIDIRSRILGKPELVCFINDDSNMVGLKHFGVVWLLEIEKPQVLRRGKGIGKIEFRDIDYLKAHELNFERWSQILIDFFSRN